MFASIGNKSEAIYHVKRRLYQWGYRPKVGSFWYNSSLHIIHTDWFHRKGK